MTRIQKRAVFEAISVSWRVALDDAQAALLAAGTILPAGDAHERTRRLADERKQVAHLLDALVAA
jgi:hypothetical protein